MFPRQTVFVVGAGASCDLKLPAGDGLRSILVNLLERRTEDYRFVDPQINTSVQSICDQYGGNRWSGEMDRWFIAAKKIQTGLPLAISIDNYLYAHRGDEMVRRIGKIAIAAAILSAERTSHLYAQPVPFGVGPGQIPYNKELDKSWYLPLMRLLTVGRSVEDLGSIFDNVAFIVFNYDRCLEHFLVNAIVAYFSVDAQSAIACVKRLHIVHPYGQVGYLPWQEHAPSADFGSSVADLASIAEGIQTFTESQDEGIVQQVKTVVSGAQTLVFMGYGFLEQNNNMLSVGGSAIRRVFATTDGISDSDVPIIEDKIVKIIGKPKTYKSAVPTTNMADIFIERGRCRALMDNHRFRLAQEPSLYAN